MVTVGNFQSEKRTTTVQRSNSSTKMDKRCVAFKTLQCMHTVILSVTGEIITAIDEYRCFVLRSERKHSQDLVSIGLGDETHF